MQRIFSIAMFAAVVALGSNRLAPSLPMDVTPAGMSPSVENRVLESGQSQTSLTGMQVFISYRNGGPIYGTYYFLEAHFCTATYYQLYGRSVKQTVMGNEQVYNWQEDGRWQLIRNQGVLGIHFRSTSNTRFFIPYNSLGYTVQVRGRADCR
ncbi:MAG: hypothetical protein WA040_18130 [Anaerolineae bacterium]